MSRLHISALQGALIAGAIAPLVTTAIPAVNSVLASELGFGPLMLGLFSSADACGTGLGSLMAAFLTRRASPRAAATAGLLLIIFANLASIALPWSTAMLMLRVLGGVGSGLTLSTCTYLFGIGNSERNYGLSMVCMMATAMVTLAVAPLIGVHFGWRAMFLFLTLILLPALLAVRNFPLSYGKSGHGTGEDAQLGRASLFSGLAAVTVATLGQIAFFTYLGSIGSAAGLDGPSVHAGLTISGIAAFLGAIVSTILGRFLSSLFSIAIILMMAIVGTAAANSSAFWQYAIGISAFYATIPLFATAVFGLLMRRAPSESFAVSISAAQLSGTAVAPAIGGVLVDRLGYGGLQWMTMVSAVIAYLLLVLFHLVSASHDTALSTARLETQSG